MEHHRLHSFGVAHPSLCLFPPQLFNPSLSMLPLPSVFLPLPINSLYSFWCPDKIWTVKIWTFVMAGISWNSQNLDNCNG